MSESTPHFAPIVVLMFLGTVLLTAIGLLVLLCGAVRKSPLILRIGAGALTAIVFGYFFLLGGVSLASSDKILPPGAAKYFCEIDCHLGYSVVFARSTAAVGPEMQQTPARGRFIIVRLKTWFDESTISPQRGDGFLTPNRRAVELVDGVGSHFRESLEGKALLARPGMGSTPLTQALRPGQSYTTDLIFDVPSDARDLRLLLTEADPETLLVIGHENSLLHKKIYLALPAIPSQRDSSR